MTCSITNWTTSAFLFAVFGLAVQTTWFPARPMSSMPRIPQWIALGDSLTQFAWRPDGGYGASLQNAYQRKLDVVQRGYSGYNTDWIVILARQVLPTRSDHVDLKFLSILLGANDAVAEGGSQYVPIDRYKRNLRTLVGILHDAGSEHYSPDTEILIIGIPPVCLGLDTRERDRTAAYARASLDVVDELQRAGDRHVRHVELHDTFLAGAKALNPEDPEQALWHFLEDGLHLSGEGYKVVATQIMEVIKTQLPQLTPENMLRFAPDWSTIDPAKAAEQLADLAHRGWTPGVAFGKG